MQCVNTDASGGTEAELMISAGRGVVPRRSDGKFDTNGAEPDMSLVSILSMAREYFFTRNDRTPETRLPVKQVDTAHFSNPGRDQLNVTWLGHSSLMINIDGYRILSDPVFEKRVSIFGPTRFNGDVPMNVSDIPDVDIVIISHDHYDHLNKYSIRQLIAKTGRFIVPLKVGKRLISWGVPKDKIVELKWWQEFRIDENIMIAAAPAQHFSGRGLTDRNSTLWASWVIKTSQHSVYYSGDSGYFDGFKEIGEKYGPFDMTFIECGAYNESWSELHMFPEETVRAHLDLKGDVLHPIHWSTFNLAFHSWYDPMRRLTAAAESQGVPVATPVVGGSTVYGDAPPIEKWWDAALKSEEQHQAGNE